MISGDSISEGVPVVGSDAIYWLPEYWKAPADNVCEIARIGRQLIFDPQASYDGLVALETYNSGAFSAWLDWLGLNNNLKYQSQIR